MTNKDIKIGDEIVTNHNGYVVVMTGSHYMGVLNNAGGYCIFSYKDDFEKTGRHFPEVKELLSKIGKENDNK